MADTTEDAKKTDLLGRPLPKEKPGPKPKLWSKRVIVQVRLNGELYSKLQQLAEFDGKDTSTYLRSLLQEDWKKRSHILWTKRR